MWGLLATLAALRANGPCLNGWLVVCMCSMSSRRSFAGVKAKWMAQVLKKPSVKRKRPTRAVIKGAIAPRVELKYCDLPGATYLADTTGSVTALNLIAVGDDNTTRDGRQVTIKSVQFRGTLVPVDNTTLPAKCRLMLVWDNAVNSGTIATVAQILNAASAAAFPLIDNQNRFTVLVDRSYVVGGVSDVATQAYSMSPACHNVEIYKSINAITQYSGTTAAIGSIQNGALLMLTIGDKAAGAGGAFLGATRVRFTDD